MNMLFQGVILLGGSGQLFPNGKLHVFMVTRTDFLNA